MKIARAEYNLFGVNTYIVWNPDTLEAAVIDPGMQNPDECFHFKQYIEQQKLQIVSLINTHLHIDHTLGNEFVEDTYGVGLTAHPADAPLGASRAQQAAMFHLRGVATTPVSIDIEVKAGDRIYLGDEFMEVIEVPGHSPAPLRYIALPTDLSSPAMPFSKAALDAPTCPEATMQPSFMPLPTTSFPCPTTQLSTPVTASTTIRDEKATNPYL